MKTNSLIDLARINALAFIFVLAALPLAITAQEAKVGTLNGNLSVSPTGAAIYTIQLDLPEGRAGMTPQIALQYNSQGEDGILGKGWGINGWSFIARVAETEYYDGKIGSVDFVEDGFALDGKRLINIGGNEYRTEIDEISKIEFHNSGKDEDQTMSYFSVNTKDGFTKLYGGTVGAKSRQYYSVYADNPIRWHLDKVIDVMGNEIEYTYIRNESYGGIYLEKIIYSKNPNFINYNNELYTILFDYEPIPNTNYILTSFFPHGESIYKYEVRRRLKSIKVIFNNNILREYQISYTNGGILNKYYLQSVTLNSEDAFINSTEFLWSYNIHEGNDITFLTDQQYSGKYEISGIAGDFSGNGITDIAESYKPVSGSGASRTYVRLNNGNGPSITLMIPTFRGKMFAGNFNGDAADELLIMNDSETVFRLYKYDNSYSMIQIGVEKSGKIMHIGDFNGDGIFDVITKEGSSYYFYSGQIDINNLFNTQNRKILIGYTGNYFIGNFTGTQKIGLLKQDGGILTHYFIEKVNENTYQFINTFSYNLPSNFQSLDVGDFNGDGKDDLIITTGSSTSRLTSIAYSFGKGFTPLYNIFVSDKWWSKPYLITDLNNDGISDIFFIDAEFNYGNERLVRYKKLFKHAGMNSGFESFTNIVSQPIISGSQTYLTYFLAGDFEGKGENSIFFSIDSYYGWNYVKRGGFYHNNYTLYQDDVIGVIFDGFGDWINIQYTETRSGHNPYAHPIMINRNALLTVSVLRKYVINSYVSSFYFFGDFLFHAKGKGVLGFRSSANFDETTGLITQSINDLLIEDEKYYHLYPSSVKVWEGNNLLSETTKIFNVKRTNPDTNPNNVKNKIFIPITTLSYTRQWDNDVANSYIGIKVHKQSMDDLDDFGNSLRNYTYADEWAWNPHATGMSWEIKDTARYFTPTSARWMVLPEFTMTISKNKETNYTPIVVRNNYKYYDNGLLEYVETLPENDEESQFVTKTTYSYNEFGNITQTELAAPNDPMLENRITEFEYDDLYEKRFLTRKIVHAPGDNFVTQYEYDPIKGLLTKETGLNNNVTKFYYDVFGKPTKTLHPDLTFDSISLHWSQGHNDAPQDAKYYMQKFKGLNGSSDKWHEVLVFYDKYQRELRTVTQNLQGSKVYVDKTYDIYGRLSSVSEPYYSSNNPSLHTFYEYDVLGRIERVINPDDTKIINSYAGRTTRTTNNSTGVWSEKVVNIMGLTDWSKDPAGNINYDYDAAGRLVQVHALGNYTNIEYDPAGNRSKLIDPSADTTAYFYNAFGELKGQIDKKGNHYSMEYDAIGRLVEKTLLTGSEITTYEYYQKQSQNGFGALERSTRNNGTEISYVYDNLGRISEKTETVDQNSFTFAYTYNTQNGMLETYQYPSGFKLKYLYNQTGSMHEVRNADDNSLLWNAVSENQRGQLVTFTHGNNLHGVNLYDTYGFPQGNYVFETGFINFRQALSYNFESSTGNLKDRTDNLRRITESFTYDEILHSRLASWSINDVLQTEMDYHANGNIDYKTDVNEPGGEYKYHSTPFAVSKVTSVTQPFEASANAKQEITYTAFNKIARIKHAFNTPPAPGTRTLDITYNPNNERAYTLHVLQYDRTPSLILKKYFFENFEVEQQWPSNPRYIHYLHGGSGLFAILVIQNSTHELYYIHKDHLGSYNAITDENGNLVETLSFDAWGRRRNPDDWTDYNVSGTLFARGFTGHEHLDQFGLINMNGRVYDPFLARFLSPDPFVQAPDYSQNYNRYSYAWNNPLKYTDPDGEWVHIAVGALIGGTMNWLANGAQWNSTGLKYFGVGALSGALGAGIGAGIGGLVSGAGHFSFGVASSLDAIGFLPGAAVGASSGFTGGFVSGTGNSLIEGNGIKQALGSGLKNGAWGAGIGGLTGGLTGGIKARKLGYDFWTGNQAKLRPQIYKSPVGNNFGRQRGECALRCFEEFSQSYGYNDMDFNNWLDKHGKLGVHASEVEGLVNSTGVFRSERIIVSTYTNNTDLSPIKEAFLNDRRVMLGFQIADRGEHAVMVSKLKLWPDGRYKIWFAETSPVRFAPRSTTNIPIDMHSKGLFGFGFFLFFPN